MANTLRIKRRTADATAPSTLASGELAYNEVGGILYYGKGNNGSAVATSIVKLGGESLDASYLTTGTIPAGRMPAFTGDVTTSAGAVATTIAANAVSLAKMAQVATLTLLGRVTAATGNVEALTAAQAKTVLAIAQADVAGLTTASSPTFAGLSVTGDVTSGGAVSASATGGFKNSTYASNVRNPIWRFGNADGYGLSYFQGTAGLISSLDTIGFHFGTATAASSILQINQVGTVTLQGSVGIGTTNPTAGQLEVAGNSDAASAPNRPRIALTNNAGTAVTWTVQPWSTSGDANLSIYRSGSTGNILLAPTGGNVGIGTTSPGARFEVRKTDGGNAFRFANYVDGGALGSWVGTYGAEFRTVTSGSVSHGMLINNNEANDARRTLDISDSNGVFATFTNGKVGIGTTSPGYKLDVAGSAWNNIARIQSSGTSSGIEIYAAGSRSGVVYSDASGFGLLNSATGWALRVNQGTDTLYIPGNVGIGTTSPANTLSLSRTGSTPILQLYSDRSAGSGGSSQLMQNRILFGGVNNQGWSTPDGAGIDFSVNYPTDSSSGKLNFWTYPSTTASPNMTIWDSKVGIGTTSPSATLHVIGSSLLSTLYSSGPNTTSFTLGTDAWVKLATIPNYSYATIKGEISSTNSEEAIEISIKTTHVTTLSSITVSRQSYNPRLLEVRVQGADGAAKVIYVRVRTSDYAPTISWKILDVQGTPTIGNTIETPVGAVYATLLVSGTASTQTNNTSFLSNTTASSSAITGALQVAGGIGVAGASFFGGAVTASNDITTTSGKFVTGASGQSVGMQLDGYVNAGSFNNYILNNSPAAGTYATLNFGRTTGLLFGFVRSNNNTEAIEIGTAATTRLTISSTGAATFGGAVSTTTGSAISYAAGETYLIWSDESEYSVADDATDSNYKTVKTFVTSKSGTFKFKFSAYIQSGTYYWAWRVLKNGSTVVASGHYNSGLDSGETTSVHAYRRFVGTVSSIDAGDSFALQMVSSTGGGSPVAGNGQLLYAKEFRIYSTTPSVEHGGLSNVWGANVGIGTASPTAKLHVAGNEYITGDAYGGLSIGEAPANYAGWDRQLNLNGTGHARLTVKTATVLMGAYAHDSWHSVSGVTPGGFLGTYNNYPVSILVNAVQRMVFDTTGNVGIGTTSPSDKLSIVGSAVARGNISGKGTSTTSFASFSLSSASYLYGINNSPVWSVGNGSFTNNNTLAPDGSLTASTLTLSTATYNLYQTITAAAGVIYKVGVWVKLGTATNFCIVVNNTAAWNTVGGRCFTSADGLSTTDWTHVTFIFTATGNINLHIGAHSETAVAQQTAGTVFAWNWEITKQNGGTPASSFNGSVSIASTTAGSAGAGALVVQGGIGVGAASYFGGNITFGTSASILNGTTGSIGLTAVGASQGITITPTGTGVFTVTNGNNVSYSNFGTSSNDQSARVNILGGSAHKAFSIAVQDLVSDALTIAASTANGGTTFTTPLLTLTTTGAATFAGAVTTGGNGTFGGNSLAGNRILTVSNTATADGAWASMAVDTSASGLKLAHLSSGWASTFLTGGPTTTQAVIYTTSSAPIVFGVNSTYVGKAESTGWTFAGAVTVGGKITSAVSTATGYNQLYDTTGLTTGRGAFAITSTGAGLAFGVESSVGGTSFTGSTAYASYFGTTTATPIHFVTNSVIRQTIDSTGAATFAGTVSATNLSGTNTGDQTNISGNAATASNSSQLNGLVRNQFWNNTGNNHSTYQTFNDIPDFGHWFMQGSGAGDSPQSGSQYYVSSVGLGNDYAHASYALMTAVARAHAVKYTYYRVREGGTWGSWVKAAAGYADSAATLQTARLIAGVSFNGTADITIPGSGITTSAATQADDILVAKYLRWKNYGNSHILFDASAGTSPTGSAVNRGTAQFVCSVAGGGTQSWGEPISLMGWNGGNTYGVRVDRARISDSTDGSAASSPLLAALANYVWSASTTPASFSLGIQASFVSAAQGFQSYGSLINVLTYSGGGGALQMYVPYSPTTYGGSGMQVRFGNYDVASGNSWTSWKTLLASDNYTSYAPSLTGGGASGSWGISVTGTASSISGYNNPTTAATANTIVYRDGSGHLNSVYGFFNYLNMSHGVSGATGDTIFYSSGDDYIRKNNGTGFRASLNVPTRTGGDASGTWGISVTGSSASCTGNAATATTASNLTTATITGQLLFNNNVTFSGNPATGGCLKFNQNAAVFTPTAFDLGKFFFEGTTLKIVVTGGALKQFAFTDTPLTPSSLNITHTAAQGAAAFILTTSDSSAANGSIRWKDNAGNYEAGIGSNFNISDSGALEFLNGGTTNMILRSSGRLGIGTTAPSQKLEIVESGSYAAMSVGNGTNLSYFGYANVVSNFNTYAQAGDAIVRGTNGVSIAGGNGTAGVRIDSAGSVGIGTTTPGAKLQVGDPGNAILSRNIISSGGYSASNVRQQNLLTFQATNVANADPFSDTSGEGGKNWHIGIVSDTAYQNTNRFSIIKAGAERVTIDASGNVSTGDVINLGRFSSIATTAYRGISWHDSFTMTDYAIFKPAGAWTQPLNIAFYTGIKIGANYGYGGTKFYNNTDMSGLLMSVGDADNCVRVFSSTSSTSAATGALQVAGGIGVGAASYFATTLQAGNQVISPNFASPSGGVAITFDNGGTNVGSWSTSRLYVNGNVGIGTTSPVGNLDVTTSGTGGWSKFVVTSSSLWGDGSTQYVTIGAGSGVTGIMINNPHVVWNAGNAGAAIRMGRSGGVSGGAYYDIGTRASDAWSIQKNASETGLFYINSAGNVGIGTASPGAKLDVNGSQILTGDFGFSADQTARLIWGRANGGAIRIRSNSAAASDRNVQFGNTDNNGVWSSYMTVAEGGNVGIGTTSPAADGLTIRREGGDRRILLKLDRPNTAGLKTALQFTVSDIMVGQIQHEYAASNYNHMSFTLRSVGGADIIPLWLENSGNVGIGTTSPSAKLHTVNTVDIEGPLFENTGGRGSITIKSAGTIHSGYVQFGNANGNSRAFIDFRESTGHFTMATSLSAGYITFNTASQVERVRILSTGNVGIGTTGPTSKLAVVGATNSYATANGSYTGGGSGHIGWGGTPTFAGYSNHPGAGMGQNITYGDNPGGAAGGTFFGGNGNYTSGGGAALYALGGEGGYYASAGVGIYAKGGTHGTWAVSGQEGGRARASAGYFDGDLTVVNGNIILGTVDTTGLTGSNGLKVTSTTASTSTTTGAVIVSGGIGVVAASFFGGTVATGALTVTGAITATGNITAYFSDDRLKTRLGPITNALEKIKSLTGFYFEPNQTAQRLGYEKKTDVGVSAQEVQAILPEIIAPAPIDPQYMTVRYEKLIPLLIEAIKAQQRQIEELQLLVQAA